MFQPTAADPLSDFSQRPSLTDRVEAQHEVRGMLRHLDWIWRIKGKIPLLPGQSNDDALDLLDSLFHQPGTSYERTGNTLTFSKKDQPAQDKMSIFDRGMLQVGPDGSGLMLRYNLASRTLIFCFLMPFFFLAMSQVMIATGNYHRAVEKAEEKAESAKKKAEPEKAALPMNPIDVALGAPAPEKKDKIKDQKKKEEKSKEKLSPTPAYVLAGIFATLYIVGRLLESWLVKSLFKKRLWGEA